MTWWLALLLVYLFGVPWGAAVTRNALSDTTPWLWGGPRQRYLLLAGGGVAWPLILFVAVIPGAVSMLLDR